MAEITNFRIRIDEVSPEISKYREIIVALLDGFNTGNAIEVLLGKDEKVNRYQNAIQQIVRRQGFLLRRRVVEKEYIKPGIDPEIRTFVVFWLVRHPDALPVEVTSARRTK